MSGLMILYFVSVTGCVSIPREGLSQAIEIQELSDHVHFLTQPALKGRKPKTWESATVRDYLKSRFKDYRLVAWEQTKGYEQPFSCGTNVIGVLPGSDPNLANEIVIVAAHYDHLGKDKKGIYCGSCDNASGVAALLETAEQLALSEKRPRRSICFASFDCEERFALGAFIFSCREDFNKSKVVAVVNIDLLGRDFLEVASDSLFVVGTEKYPGLRARVLQAGAKNGIRILPIGTDLVGPRGDHVAFETMGMPVLFFSCGLYKDYHKPTDTADKLNYPKMQNSAMLIAETVNILANAEQIERPVKQEYGDKVELQALLYIIETLSSKYEQAGLNREQAEKLGELAKETQQLSDNDEYTVEKRRRFLRKAVKGLLPVLAVVDKTFTKDGEELLWMGELYADHRDVLTEKFRDLVCHFETNKPGLFGKTKFNYKSYNLAEDELSFTKRDDGQYEFHLILMQIKIDSEMGGWIFKHGYFKLGFSNQIRGCVGSREQITDFCLLHWREDLKDESYARIWRKILVKVTGQNEGENYNDWLQWRLKQKNLDSEKKWVLQLLGSDNPNLAWAAAMQACKIAGKKEAAILNLIRDKNVRADIRGWAISSLTKGVGREGLLALVDVLGDQTLRWKSEYLYFLSDSYPFSDHITVSLARKWYEEKGKSVTVGNEAERKLRDLTKKDFGKDARAWRKWIEGHVK